MSNKYYCEECQDTGEVENGDNCQECCPHEFDPDEGYMCLNCNKDGYEDAVCAAENLIDD